MRAHVTVGVGGFGRAIVKAFMEKGASVFDCDIDVDILARLEAEPPGVHTAHCAIPHLKQSPAVSIINMSSVAGRFGYPNRIAYSTTKWGLVGFTKTLSIELGAFDIHVNAVLPGAVDRPHFKKVLDGRAMANGKSVGDETVEVLAAQSIKRLVKPAHIADLAVFIASDSGQSLSGQMLPIDCDIQHA